MPELKHPTGDFTVTVDDERAGVLRARGYHDVGVTAPVEAAVVAKPQKVSEPPKPRKPAARLKPVPKPPAKPRGRPKKAR